jgi:hypothetical protein
LIVYSSSHPVLEVANLILSQEKILSFLRKLKKKKKKKKKEEEEEERKKKVRQNHLDKITIIEV